MRFRTTLFDRRDYADPPAGTRTAPRGEYGVDGDSWLNQMLGGGPDVNPALTGSAKFAVYDEMRKTDAAVKSMLSYWKLGIRGATWSLEPRDENDALAVLIRDMVAWNLGLEDEDGHMALSWDEQTQQALQMFEWGCMLEELVWHNPTDGLVTWYDADGDSHLVLPLDRLAPRYPASISKVKQEAGRITEVTQWTPGARPIPGDKISYLIAEREGNRWDGVSMLRSAWGSWWLKKSIIVATGIGWDRFAHGLPLVWHPDTDNDKKIAERIGRGLRSHDQGFVALPVPQGGKPKEDSEWLVELLNGAGTIADPVGLLKWCDDQTAINGLQQFTRQGLGETGARASAETQIDPFYAALNASADYLRRQRAREVIHRIVEVNFGAENAQRRSPVLKVAKIQVRDIETTAKAIALLADAGFTFTDRGAQDDVRDLLGMARLPDDGELEQAGISREQLLAVLRSAGLDQQTLARVVAGLPDGVGVARNRDQTGEGGDLLAA